MATVTRGVAAGERAGLLSAVFTASYLAFSLPAIAAGIAATQVGLRLTAEVYSGTVIVLALAAVAGLLLRREPTTAPARPAAQPQEVAVAESAA
jgi:hypothetical protein